MRDRLTFTTRRQGHYIEVCCGGHDAAGAPVNFELDPYLFQSNQRRELAWTDQVVNAQRVFCTLLGLGMDDAAAYTIAEAFLPAPLTIATDLSAGRAAMDEEVADHADEVLEGLDEWCREVDNRER